MKQKITFTDITQRKNVTPKPIPASSMIPEWYKKTESYVGGKKLPPITAGVVPDSAGWNVGTIKRCMPFFDAMVSGYLILTPADLYVTQTDDEPMYEWSEYNLLGFHSIEQNPMYPQNPTNSKYPKFTNPWSIKTPKGYSTLFTTPLHRDVPFFCLEGVVDTDKYSAPVNIIFTLKDKNFEGLIPRGTPFAQVIPFKRESWKMEIGGDKELKEQYDVAQLTNTKFFDKYKTFFRSTKEYK